MEFRIDCLVRTGEFQMPSEHYHLYYELFYMRAGQGRMFIEHTVYQVTAGDVILLSPLTLHYTTYEPGAVSERVAIYIGRDSFAGEQEQSVIDELFEKRKIHIAAGKVTAVETIMQKLFREASQRDDYSELLLRGYFCELIACLGRYGQEEWASGGDAEDKAIIKVAEYLYYHFAEPVSLSQAAGQAALSPAYFSRRFKQVTGFSFKEYLNHLRMKEAARQLLETKHSITMIAFNCGFNDSNYFGDAFRKVTGMSPREYRKSPPEYEPPEEAGH